MDRYSNSIVGLFVLVATTMLLAGSSQAGILVWPVETEGWQVSHDLEQLTPLEYNLSLNEVILGAGAFDVVVAGDIDPVFHVTKQVENNSGVAWTAYDLALSGGSATFSGTPTSDIFTSAELLSPTLIHFSEGTVHQGNVVRLDFDISVPMSGLFSFTLTQVPIPEPATLAFLGGGGMLVVAARMRRRHK